MTGSLMTKAQGLAGKVLPDGVKAAAHRRLAEPGTGNRARSGGHVDLSQLEAMAARWVRAV